MAGHPKSPRAVRACPGDVLAGQPVPDAEGAHLRWFILSDRLRGQGMGKRLLSCATAFADAKRYANTFLWTFAGLDAARHLYEAAGFRLVHEADGQQWGTRVAEQRFERVVG